MTYGEIFEEFKTKYPNIEIEDYRPANGFYVKELGDLSLEGIVVWLKDKRRMIYLVNEEEKTTFKPSELNIIKATILKGENNG